jgi:hypothetical protein
MGGWGAHVPVLLWRREFHEGMRCHGQITLRRNIFDAMPIFGGNPPAIPMVRQARINSDSLGQWPLAPESRDDI